MKQPLDIEQKDPELFKIMNENRGLIEIVEMHEKRNNWIAEVLISVDLSLSNCRESITSCIDSLKTK